LRRGSWKLATLSQGNFSRDNLISYNVPMEGEVTLTRLDTNESVTLSYDPSIIPADAMMQPLMGKALQGIATQEEKEMFGTLWQARVEKILLSETLWDQMITPHLKLRQAIPRDRPR